MPAAGDMTVVLNADETRMVAGLRRAEAAAQRSGAAIGGALSAGVGRGVQNVGFMIQDFSSIMMNGGANSLGRAIGAISNNVQMLGAGLGPWGAAVSAVGGALAGILIPAIIKANDELDGYAKQVEDAIAATDKMADRMKRGIEFEQQLRDLQNNGTEKDVQAAQKKTQNEQEQVTRELQMRREAFRRQMDDAFQRGAAFPTAGIRRPGMNAAGQFDASGRFTGDVTFDPNSPDAVKAGEAFQKELERIKELEDRQKRLGNREGALAGMDEIARKRDIEKKQIEEAAKKAKEYDEELRQRARKLEADVMTPSEKHALRMRDLEELYYQNQIGSDTFGRGAAASALELNKGQKNTQGAASFGSNEAAQAIIRAQANNSKADETQKLWREFVEQAREHKRLLQEIEKNTANQQVVEFP